MKDQKRSKENQTMRKNKAEPTKYTEEDYRSIWDAANDGILVHDTDTGAIIAFNQKACEMFGHSKESFPRTSPLLTGDGAFPCDNKELLDHMRKAAEGRPQLFEWMAKDNNGRAFWAEVSLKCVPIGGKASLLAFVRDITKQKKTEEALKKSEEHYRTIFENTGAATAIFEEDATISLANTECEKLSGYRKDEIEGKKKWTDFVLKEDLDKMLEINRTRRFDKDAAPRSCEFRLVDRQGRIKNIFLSIDMIPGTKKSVASLLDITDRKHAEDLTRKSEDKYRELVENANSIILRMDPVGHVTFFNEFAQRFFGYAEEDILGKNVVGTIVPETESTGRDLRSLIEDIPRNPDRYVNNINENMRRNGEKVWIAWTNKPVMDKNGRVIETLCIGNDITERKKMEAALQESQQYLADIIDFLPDATLVIDRTGTIIAWNRAMEAMTGVASTDMLGKGDYEYAIPFYGKRRSILIDLALHHDEKMAKRYSNIEKQGEILVGETYVPNLKGKEVYLYGTAATLHDQRGNIIGAIESIRNITEKRHTQVALKESEEKYRILVENANDAIFIAQDGVVKFANPKTEELFGLSAGELSMTPWIRHVHPEDRDMMLERHRIRTRGGALPNVYSVRAVNKQGKELWLEVSAVSIQWESRPATLNIIRDISQQKKMESQLRETQKLEAIGTLAGGIAHDFNNILAAIMGYTEMAKVKLKQAELHRYLDHVLSACGRAKNLVNQILTFSRRQEKEVKPMDVGLLLKESLKLLRATIPSTIKIRSNISSGEFPVLADPTQMHQVIVNLCTNAAYSMREKGGVLEITLNHREVTETNSDLYPTLHAGRYVEFTVRDTGTGIEQGIMRRIFDPFFTTKKAGEGTGLGLSVVYGIVQECGGTVTVESEPGAGSVFRVYLPAINQTLEPASKLDAEIRGGNERILFVDDEETLSDLGREILETLGYKVVATTNSMRALDLFRNRPERFDLVVTDLTMPGMTGVDLTKAILTLRPDIPIILCTGFGELMTGEDAKRLGVKALIIKPISVIDIANTVRRVLDKKQDP